MSKFIRQSKFRNLHCSVYPRDAWYDEVQTCTSNQIEGSVLACSEDYLALTSQANHGASIEVRKLVDFGKPATRQNSHLRGHSQQVNSIQFSPFNSHIILSGSADGSIKVWDLSKWDLSTDLTRTVTSIEPESQSLVEGLACHPSANGIVACYGKNNVSVVDLTSQTTALSFADYSTDRITDMCWNYQGSVLATVDKSKNGKFLDPRIGGNSVQEMECHAKNRNLRIVWAGKLDEFITTGMSAMQEREIKLWDFRNLAKPVHRERVDTGTGPLMPLYDSDTNLLCVGGKGDASLRFYEVDLSKKPFLHAVSYTSIGDISLGIAFGRKRACDIAECEVIRVHNLTKSSVVPIRVEVPRKEAKHHFQTDLYPNSACYEPALEGHKWLEKEDRFPVEKPVSLSTSKPVILKHENESQATFCAANTIASSNWNTGGGWDIAAGGTTVPTGMSTSTDWNSGAGWGQDPKPSTAEPSGSLEQSTDSVKTEEIVLETKHTALSTELNTDIRTPETVAEEPYDTESTSSKPRGLSSKAIQLGSKYSHKFKYMEGRMGPRSSSFFNLHANVTNPLCYSAITANSRYFATAMNGTGGPVYVHPLDKPGKIAINPHVLNHQKQPVLDHAFSPYEESCLATASDDATINIWNVEGEEGDMVSDMSSVVPCSTLKGHGRGVRRVVFHPTAKNVLCSSSTDCTVRTWDIVCSSEESQLCMGGSRFEEPITDLSFNPCGSTLAATSQDKILRILDVRQSRIAAMACAHDGSSKGLKVAWARPERENFVLTVGCDSKAQRQISIWDVRNLLDPVAMTSLDASSSILIPLLDVGSDLVYLASKGEQSILTFEIDYSTQSSVLTNPCTPFSIPGQAICGMTMLPKTMCDVKAIEVNRFLCLTQKSLETISFHVPRAEKLRAYFQDDLYRPVPTYCYPYMTAEEWFGGNDQDPNLRSLQPDGMTPLSAKEPDEVKQMPKVVSFREKQEKEEREKQAKEAEIDRLRVLANKRAEFHPNLSMGKSTSEVAEDSSEDEWGD